MTSAHPAEDVRIFHKECVSLVDAGYEVYLVERGDSYEKSGVHIVGVGEIPQSRRKRMTVGAKMVYKAAVKIDADIYHFHDPELLPYGLKLKKLGKKVVFDSHELTREQIAIKPYLPVWLAKIISWCYAIYEDYILKRIDGVIFPCLINGRFPLPGKYTALLNNVPRLDEFYNLFDSSVEKEYDIGMAGSLTYNRGITHMVKAINKVGCEAYIGGKFDSEEYEDELKEIASPKIHFLGYLNRDQVMDLTRKSRIGCSALLNVGQYVHMGNFSTKVYEYMSMGIPVILSNNEYNLKMNEKYGFGICIDPENIDEYAEAIKYLLNNPEEAVQMGLNGRRAIKEEFNWENEFINMEKLYEDVLAL